MLATKQRPFREFVAGQALQTSAPSLFDPRWWDRQVEEDEEANLGAHLINPLGRMGGNGLFEPLNVVLIGRKGSGKTLTMTALAGIYDASFNHSSLGNRAGLRRIGANYYIDFVHARGPLGRQVETVFDEETRSRRRAWVPVDPCDQEIYRWLPQFPVWSYHTTILLDEMADLLGTANAQSRVVKDWGHVMRQQRHIGCEYLGATNQIGAVSNSTIIRHIDLLVLVKPHRSVGAAELLVYDMHGLVTGKRHRYLPPREEDYDWRVGIWGLRNYFSHYNTHQIIASAWDPNAEALIRRAQLNAPTWRTKDRIEFIDQAPAAFALPVGDDDDRIW